MKIVSDETGELKCGSCEVYGDKCLNCTETKCSSCAGGYVVNPKNGKCVSCGELYEGCGKCSFDVCLECEISSWTLTSYGCIDMSDYLQSTSSKTSHSTTSESLKRSSVAASSNKNESGSNGGLIAGIIVGILICAAIVGLVIYLVKSKREDGSNYVKENDEDNVHPYSKNNAPFGDDDIEMVIPV